MAVIERPIDVEILRADSPQFPDKFWRRPFSALIPLDREMVVFLALTLIAGILRFWDLGSRMLHHDESLHAVYSYYYLYIGKGYIHDPMMHGPFLFEMNALVYFLLGATDATARVAPALFGTVLVGLPYFLRDRLGRTGAIVTAALLAISPTILYYSRFIRHDIYQIFFMNEMVEIMEACGIQIELHHHEVATAGQGEIDMRFDTLTKMADKAMLYKYIVKNVGRGAGAARSTPR